MKMEKITCPVCGETINQEKHRCNYCGTSYAIECGENFVGITACETPCKVFNSGRTVNEKVIEMYGEDKVREFIIKDFARNLADAIAPMMDIKTRYDYENRCRHVVGTIRVVEPDYRF